MRLLNLCKYCLIIKLAQHQIIMNQIFSSNKLPIKSLLNQSKVTYQTVRNMIVKINTLTLFIIIKMSWIWLYITLNHLLTSIIWNLVQTSRILLLKCETHHTLANVIKNQMHPPNLRQDSRNKYQTLAT